MAEGVRGLPVIKNARFALGTNGGTGRRLRALMLHGKGGEGARFRERMAPIVDSFTGIDFTFPTAPFCIDEEKSGFAWWTLPPGVRSFEATRYIGVEKSIESLQEICRNEGPFDILWGHSQGAILLSSILASPSIEFPEPKVIILNGCAWPKPFESDLESFKKGHLPSLHVVGREDKVNPAEQGVRVARSFGQRARVFEHAKGHIVPCDEAAISCYTGFLKTHLLI